MAALTVFFEYGEYVLIERGLGNGGSGGKSYAHQAERENAHHNLQHFNYTMVPPNLVPPTFCAEKPKETRFLAQNNGSHALNAVKEGL
jgi:hypothetical protein